MITDTSGMVKRVGIFMGTGMAAPEISRSTWGYLNEKPGRFFQVCRMVLTSSGSDGCENATYIALSPGTPVNEAIAIIDWRLTGRIEP